MPSTSIITSCTVVAAITYMTIANPIPQAPSIMGSNPAYNGQVGAPGMGSGSIDSAGMGGNSISNMGSGTGTPSKNPASPTGANSGLGPYASTSNPASLLPKSQPSMNMDVGAMPGGPKLGNSMSPTSNSAMSRPTNVGGMDDDQQYSPLKNHTTSTLGASEMGSPGMGTESYVSGAGMYGNNSTNGSPNKHTNPSGVSVSQGLSDYLIQFPGAATGAAIALVLLA